MKLFKKIQRAAIVFLAMMFFASLAHAAWDPNEEAGLKAADAQGGDRFGYRVGISGDTAIVGAYRDDDNGRDSGSAYVFEKIAGLWTRTAKLKPSDGGKDDRFGSSVSISGDTIVVGALQDDDLGSNTGAVYVFEKGTGWANGSANQAAKLVADGGYEYARFGNAVCIDGDTLIVGAWWDDGMAYQAGAAYIFERGAGWTNGSANQVVKLYGSDTAYYDEFGISVSVSGDTAVVSSQSNGNFGAAYVFENNAGIWTESARLSPDDPQNNDAFGWSVSVHGDTVLVGSRDEDAMGSSSGSAYVFEKGPGWMDGSGNQSAKLTASDGDANDLLGQAVALSGSRAVVTAMGDEENGNKSGSVYVFEKGAGWEDRTEIAKLTASDGEKDDMLGVSAAIDGDTILAGAHGFDNGLDYDSGAAYIFQAPVPGDIDGDGGISGRDLAALNAMIGTCSEYPAILSGLDLDGDGCVTKLDRHIWIRVYGTNPAFRPPPWARE
jgi:FG-GAP repeat protein/dockerin type I repeat protein